MRWSWLLIAAVSLVHVATMPPKGSKQPKHVKDRMSKGQQAKHRMRARLAPQLVAVSPTERQGGVSALSKAA